jgi:hypothetical protein
MVVQGELAEVEAVQKAISQRMAHYIRQAVEHDEQIGDYEEFEIRF